MGQTTTTFQQTRTSGYGSHMGSGMGSHMGSGMGSMPYGRRRRNAEKLATDGSADKVQTP